MSTGIGGALALLALVAVVSAQRERRRLGPPSAASAAVTVLAVGSSWSASSRWEDVLWTRGVVVASFFVCVLVHVARQAVGRRPEHPAAAPVLAALALWSWLFLVDAVINSVPTAALLGRSVSGLVLVGALLLVLSGGLALRDVRIAATWSLALLCWSVPFLDTSWRACDAWSCGVAGRLLTGPFSSENAFGIQAGLLV
ncbi:hypothetical protein WDZ17_05280, partial [Pseudokineococcus basanitobsidens]